MSEPTAILLNTARAMAQALVDRDTDINEFAKIATYVRTHHNGAQFFRLLETMVKDGHLVRSGRTLDYYRNIQEVCRQHLGTYRQAQDEQAQELAEILGWTTRLMRFYKEQGVPPAERQAASRAGGTSPPQASRREEQSRDVTSQRQSPGPLQVLPLKRSRHAKWSSWWKTPRIAGHRSNPKLGNVFTARTCPSTRRQKKAPDAVPM